MSKENAANADKPKRHFQQQRKDAPARIVDASVDIKDLSRTESTPGLSPSEKSQSGGGGNGQHPELESNLPQSGVTQAEDNIHYIQQKQPVQQIGEIQKLHHLLQESNIQQKTHDQSIDPQSIIGKISRVGRPLEKEEPDHKMMCYLPESLYETFKEGRLEEKFQNDRAFYVHIFASYFKGKSYDQYNTAGGATKGKPKQKSKSKRG